MVGSSAWVVEATAASLGASVCCFVRNPASVVQQRIQVGSYGTLTEAVSGLAQEDGSRAFFRGLTASIAREIPFAFLQFPLYESLKRQLAHQLGHERITAAQGAVCGSIAGSIAAAVTTPLDVLRTRQMLGAGPNTRGGSMLHELATVVAKDGIAALFRGVGPRTGWMALGGCIFFGAYEQSTALLRRLQDEP